MQKQLFTIFRAVLLCLVCSGNAVGQPGGTSPDPGMISGTSNSFGINDIFSTSLFNGSVNITVPFYTYTNEDHSYNVSLAYNTKGVLVDEIDNAAGLHWELLSGPSIQRIVRDIPDEMLFDSHVDSLDWNGGRLVYKDRYVKGKLATYWETPAEQAQTNVYRDGECDEFIVTLNGSRFSFYLGKDLNIFTHPHRNIRIRTLIDGVPAFSFTTPGMAQDPTGHVLSFEITDEQGIVYLFEQGDLENKEHHDNVYWDYPIVSSNAIVRWNIKKITLPDGNVITYNYMHSWDPGSTGNFSFTKYINYYAWETSTGAAGFEGQTGVNGSIYYSQIQSISYPNGNTVKFQYDDNTRMADNRKQLKEIQVASIKTSQNCVRYKFFQSQNASRWYLDSINMYSCDNSYGEKYYSFRYNQVRLPRRLNVGQDLFGYYNADSIASPLGTSGTKFNIPKHHFQAGGSLNYGLNKSYLPYYAQASLLTSIRNAFGAEVQFTYKNNSSDIASPFPIPGSGNDENFVGAGNLGMDGVAIDSIVQTDKYHPGEKLITKLDYHNSGMLFTPGGYVHYPKYINQQTNSWDSVTYQGLYLTAHQFINGSNHGYSNVGIRKYNGAGQLLSRVEQTFTNISDALSSSRFYKVPGSKELYEYPYANKQYIKDWEIGLPLVTTVYDNNNRIVEKTTNEYTFSNVELSSASDFSSTKTSKVNTGQKVSGAFGSTSYFPDKITFTDTYYPYTGTAHLTQVTNEKYTSDTRFVSDITNYVYDSHNNIINVLTRNSKGDQISTQAIYNYNVDGPNNPYGTVNPNTSLFYMGSAGLEKLIGMEQWKTASNFASQPYANTLLNAFIIGYEFNNGKLYKKRLYNSIFTNPVPYSTYTGITMGGTTQNPYSKILAAYNAQYPADLFQKTSEVTLYDSKNNPLENRVSNDGRYSAAIYDTSTNVILAGATNAKYNEIAFTSFEDVGAADFYKVRGNLDLNSENVVDISGSPSLSGVTGHYIYQLTPHVPNHVDYSDIIGKQDLTAGKDYLLSFWCMGGVPQVYLGTSPLQAPSSPMYEWNGWKNYVYRFHVTSPAKIEISPLATNTISLDEIRLCPADAAMKSYTFIPLYGAGSFTDTRGRITYYEYDPLGRLKLIRDQERNILGKAENSVNGGL